MARDGAEFDADIWTDEAVRTSEHWAEVRALAAAALDEFSAPRPCELASQANRKGTGRRCSCRGFREFATIQGRSVRHPLMAKPNPWIEEFPLCAPAF